VILLPFLLLAAGSAYVLLRQLELEKREAADAAEDEKEDAKAAAALQARSTSTKKEIQTAILAAKGVGKAKVTTAASPAEASPSAPGARQRKTRS
jgi:hydroxypyruvate isomerase